MVSEIAEKLLGPFERWGSRGIYITLSCMEVWNYKSYFEKALNVVLGGGFKYFFYFRPCLGKIPILTSIFFRWVVQPPTSVSFHKGYIFSIFLQVKIQPANEAKTAVRTGGFVCMNRSLPLAAPTFQQIETVYYLPKIEGPWWLKGDHFELFLDFYASFRWQKPEQTWKKNQPQKNSGYPRQCQDFKIQETSPLFQTKKKNSRHERPGYLWNAVPGRQVGPRTLWKVGLGTPCFRSSQRETGETPTRFERTSWVEIAIEMTSWVFWCQFLVSTVNPCKRAKGVCCGLKFFGKKSGLVSTLHPEFVFWLHIVAVWKWGLTFIPVPRLIIGRSKLLLVWYGFV